MQEHLLTVLVDESTKTSAAETAQRIAARAAQVESLRASGAYVDHGRLRPSSEGKRVRGDAVESGPFAGDVIGSYLYVRTPSLDAATEIAKAIPRGPSDAVEVRPPMKANMQPGKDALAGKVFAFAVLGSAPNEEAWIATMDRIDAETADQFPEKEFLGGMRLAPPKSGRRIASTKDGGLVLDSPFMEAKELIGGIFFMRMASLDEAVAWAKTTGFVRHGTLEIRELWRA